MENWIIILFILTILVEIIIILYITKKHRKQKEIELKKYEEWLTKLQSDPTLWRLYQAHWESRLKTSLAVLIDMSIVVLIVLGFLDFIYKFKADFPEDIFRIVVSVVSILICLILLFGQLWILGSTIGLRIMNIVAVSSKTGKVVYKKFVYPHKGSYRKNRIIDYFFVPKDIIQNKIIY